jgi:hypothetical protein
MTVGASHHRQSARYGMDFSLLTAVSAAAYIKV